METRGSLVNKKIIGNFCNSEGDRAMVLAFASIPKAKALNVIESPSVHS